MLPLATASYSPVLLLPLEIILLMYMSTFVFIFNRLSPLLALGGNVLIEPNLGVLVIGLPGLQSKVGSL